MPGYDVFLSHNGRDKPVVELIAERLKGAGIEPWLDKWLLVPGVPWQDGLAEGLRSSASCAVFFGPNELGSWEIQELDEARNRAAVDRSFRLIPVLLPGLPDPFDPNRLPPFVGTRTWVDLRRGIEDERAFEILVNAIRGLPPGPGAPAELPASAPPYRGLAVFQEEDAGLFFGREGEVQRLVEKLKPARFLAVVAPSGSGKSSLVRAGLIPALRRGELADSDQWDIRLFTPGERPLASLALPLIDGNGGDLTATLDAVSRLEARLLADERTLDQAVRLGRKRRLALVVDQFEEVFTLCRSDAERAAFLANLLYASFVPDGPVVVLLTMRADFYPKCASHPDLAARISAHQFLLGPLDAEGLARAIEEPARRSGVELERGLVETILGDMLHQPGALPLMQQALLELWERRRGRVMTLDAYRESGGVEGAVAQRAETVFAGLSPERQALARRILLRLTQPGEGTEDTRRRALLSDLVVRPEEQPAVEDVVGALAAARLVTTGHDRQMQEPTVEVSHEALIRGWPRLRAWIDEDRAGILLHRRLSEAAREWQRLGRDEGGFYRGARLAQALEWRERGGSELNPLEREFLDESLALRRREETAEAERQRRELEQAREFARQSASRELAAAAVTCLDSDPELGVLLGLAAVAATREVDGTVTAQAHDALQKAVECSRVRLTFRGHQGRVHHVAVHPDGKRAATAGADGTGRVWSLESAEELFRLVGHAGDVSAVAFSPDGSRLATAGADHIARIWDAATGKSLAVLTGHAGPVNAVAWSPAGAYLATAGEDRTIQVWDAGSGKALRLFEGHAKGVNGIAFRPEGQQIATASSDNTVCLWSFDDGEIRQRFSEYRDRVMGVAYSPDGRKLATISYESPQRIWDAFFGQLAFSIPGHDNWGLGVEWSSDGTLLATAGADGVAIVWDGASGQRLFTLLGHKGWVESLAFTPDGTRLVTAGADGTARVWETALISESLTLDSHSGRVSRRVFRARFSPNGERIASSGQGSLAIWDTSSGELLKLISGAADDFWELAWSPDGARIATARADNTAVVFDASSGAELATLRGHVNWIIGLAFHPDGSRLATVGADQRVMVWDIASGGGQTLHPEHADWVNGVAWSLDGRYLATTSNDQTVYLWEADSSELARMLTGHTHFVHGVEFSRDGRKLATSSHDGTARIWDVQSGEQLLVLHGHADWVRDIALSPDGTRAATAGKDTTVRIWDMFSGRELMLLPGHAGEVWSVDWSPDGKHLVTASWDRTVRLWDAGSGEELRTFSSQAGQARFVPYSPDGKATLYRVHIDDLVRLAQQRTTRGLTPEERRKYLHEE
ncbi:MAG TPA: TIR domain-containing protein [Thermoanaerobaculia bacterium]